jgi:hypothetical protein
MVAIGLQHFGTDDDRSGPGETGESNSEFRVALANTETALGLPAYRDVARRSEFFSKQLHRRLT